MKKLMIIVMVAILLVGCARVTECKNEKAVDACTGETVSARYKKGFSVESSATGFSITKNNDTVLTAHFMSRKKAQDYAETHKKDFADQFDKYFFDKKNSRVLRINVI